MSPATLAALEAIGTYDPFVLAIASILIQITLIAAAASLVARWCGRDAIWMHRIWLTGVFLMLAIVPFHACSVAWKISIPQVRSNAPVEKILFTAGEDEFRLAGNERTGSSMKSETNQAFWANESVPVSHDVVETDIVEVAEPETVAETGSVVPASPEKDSGRFEKATAWSNWLISVYMFGFLLSITRLLMGIRFLEKLRKHAASPGPELLLLITDLSKQLKLRVPPQTRLVGSLDLPLVYGLTTGVLLLPRNFELWSGEHQKAVLMHELLHIKRRDIASELVSRLMRACYWFHPAAWLVSRQMAVARELATDQSVVQAGCDATLYASRLLEILGQVAHRVQGESPRSPAVAMSGFSGIERRLKWILEASPMRLPRLRGGLLLVLLTVLTLVTTVQVRWTMADDDVGQGNEKSGQLDFDEAARLATVRPTDNDLYQRIKRCAVLKVEGEDYAAEFMVSGQVFASDGKPVAGAIVVLRESTMMRLNSEPEKYLYRGNRDWTQMDDVFARVETDAEGRFYIEAARAPAVGPTWQDRWEGDIFAGHPVQGIGWMPIPAGNEQVRVVKDAVVRLQPSSRIEGRYLSPDGKPLANKMVQLSGFGTIVEHPSSAGDRLNLAFSQLIPRAITDAAGRFEFVGLPSDVFATVRAVADGELLGQYALVATSSNMPLGKQTRKMDFGIPSLRAVELLGTPCVLIADPGIRLRGVVVDEQQRAVADARVSFSGSADSEQTNDRGQFQLHLPTNLLEDADGNLKRPQRLYISPATPGLLAKPYQLSDDEIETRKNIQVELIRGNKVSGKVVTSKGEPCKGIQVVVLEGYTQQAETDGDGRYEIFLQPGDYSLAYVSNGQEYRLPTLYQLRSSADAGDAKGVVTPKRKIKVVAGKPVNVEDVVVELSPIREVLVVMPDGKPAERGAIEVEVEDDGRSFGKNSADYTTDSNGVAKIVSPADARPYVVKARFSTAETSYSGQMIVEDKVGEEDRSPLRIQLSEDWIVRGRVLFNGQPVIGAVASIMEIETVQENRNGQIIFSLKSSNELQAITGADGRFETWMRAGKNYIASIRSLPGDMPRITGNSENAYKVDEGIYEFKDFEFTEQREEISGTIVDLDGKPIEGASVEVESTGDVRPDNWVEHNRSSQFTTDKLGRFALKGMPNGEYRIRIYRKAVDLEPERYVDAKTGERGLVVKVDTRPSPAIPTLKAARVISLAMDAAVRKGQAKELDEVEVVKSIPGADEQSAQENTLKVRGVVVDGDGTPIVGAKVRLKFVTVESNARTSIHATHPQAPKEMVTDSAGRFETSVGDAISVMAFVIEADGFTPQSINWIRKEAERGKDQPFKVELSPGASISGRLVGAGGAVAGAILQLCTNDPSHEAGLPARTTETDAEGRFRFDHVPPETLFSLSTRLEQSISGVLPVSLISSPANNELADFGNVTTQPPSDFTITVQTLDGSPLPAESSVRVNREGVYGGSAWRLSADGGTDAAVTFGAGDEMFSISVRAPGYKVIRTLPDLAPNLFGAYRVKTPESKHITFVLVKE